MSAMAVERENEAEVDEPWPLPVGWAWAPLGSLGTWTGGGTPSKAVEAYWNNGSVPWVSPKDMKSDVIRETEDRITEAAVRDSATKFVSPSSVLMVMRSGILRHTFPVAVNADRVTLNQDLRALTPANGIEPRFIAHYLRSVQRTILHDCSKDGTTVQSMDASALEQVKVPVAPTFEQRRIVARIDELFAEIAEGEAALERACNGLDTWRRALLKAAVTGELTRDWREMNKPTETGADLMNRVRGLRKSTSNWGRARRASHAEALDISLLPELPKTWAWAKLDDIGQIVGGVTVDKKRVPTDPVTVPYLRVANVQRGHLDLSEIKTIDVEREVADRLRLQTGDILLNEGGDRDKIGRGWVWRGEMPNCIHQNHVFRMRPCSEDINPFFISHYANELGRAFFIEKGKQTTNLASISLSKISQFPVPVPPTEETNVMIERLERHFSTQADDRRDIDEASNQAIALRQAILKSAFEGRLVPQDPNDEPAAVLLARLREQNPTAVARRIRGRRTTP